MVDITLLDRNDAFLFGFSKLEVMLGRESADDVRLPYAEIGAGRFEFSQATVRGIDPIAKRVETDSGVREADYLVVAMGADYEIAATPGFEEGGHEYYTLAGAERLRDALTGFDGGKVLVAVLGQPFKCPPAPFEGAFLLHEYFLGRGVREAVDLTMAFPMHRPVPVTGEVSQMFRDGLAGRGIEERPQHLVTSIDPDARVAHLAGGESLGYDLFVGVPIHRAPDPLPASGMTDAGWVPVDQSNLRTGFPGVYAVGHMNGTKKEEEQVQPRHRGRRSAVGRDDDERDDADAQLNSTSTSARNCVLGLTTRHPFASTCRRPCDLPRMLPLSWMLTGQSSEYGTAPGSGEGGGGGCVERAAGRVSRCRTERGGLVRGIRRGFEVGLDLAGRDLGGLARLQVADELGGRTADDAAERVLLDARQLGDVEVAHRELADAVEGRTRRRRRAPSRACRGGS